MPMLEYKNEFDSHCFNCNTEITALPYRKQKANQHRNFRNPLSPSKDVTGSSASEQE